MTDKGQIFKIIQHFRVFRGWLQAMILIQNVIFVVKDVLGPISIPDTYFCVSIRFPKGVAPV